MRLEDDVLLLDEMPEVWPHARLVRKAPGVFDVASLPIEISFAEDAAGGDANTMHVKAPALLGDSIPKVFKRGNA